MPEYNCRETRQMPEIPDDSPAVGCFLLHSGNRIEENQSVGPDLFLPRAGTRARGPNGRFAKGHSGNPKGRPRGIPNPKRRAIGLPAWRADPEAARAVAKRRPWLLRPLLMQTLPPPVGAQDPAERLGIRIASVRTPDDAQRVLLKIWAGLSRGDIGTGEAARLARRVRRQLRLQRRFERIARRLSRAVGRLGNAEQPQQHRDRQQGTAG